jgi:ATP-dependent Lon protease
MVTGAFARQVLGPVTAFLPMDAPGRVFGLAWTPLGGTVMPVEVAVLAGEGGVRVTGRVGEVMGESLQAAYTWLRIHARSIGIPPELSQRAMHVHFPEAATPKDGPSAGLTLVAGMLSALSNQVALPRAAFTGEITIMGEVLPVGGIREKLLAALRAGIQTVILPEENRKDVRMLSPRDRKLLRIHFVRRLDDFVDILTAEGAPDAGQKPLK